jgi:mono/diheme cytochrome c family protein
MFIISQRPGYRSVIASAGIAASHIQNTLCGIAVCVFAILYASSSYGADASRGRALYENHCQFCHTPKIHTRPNRLPATKNEVRLLVDDWRRQENLAWTPEEVEDVLEYLNVTRYHFPPN